MTRPNRAAPSSWASRLCYPYQHQHHAYCYWYAQGTTMLCHLSGESLSWGRGVLRKKDDMIVGSREHLEVFLFPHRVTDQAVQAQKDTIQHFSTKIWCGCVRQCPTLRSTLAPLADVHRPRRHRLHSTILFKSAVSPSISSRRTRPHASTWSRLTWLLQVQGNWTHRRHRGLVGRNGYVSNANG